MDMFQLQDKMTGAEWEALKKEFFELLCNNKPSEAHDLVLKHIN
jgi:hypothetical protein